MSWLVDQVIQGVLGGVAGSLVTTAVTNSIHARRDRDRAKRTLGDVCVFCKEFASFSRAHQFSESAATLGRLQRGLLECKSDEITLQTRLLQAVLGLSELEVLCVRLVNCDQSEGVHVVERLIERANRIYTQVCA